MPVSENRIRIETKWPNKTPGEKILEVGSGSGRFTEQLIKKEAFVASFDASVAVEANYASHGNNPAVLIVQADIYQLPFRDAYFDRMVCIGVLQHTPDPGRSIESIVTKVKRGGSCVMDIYRRHNWYRQIWNTRYWVRPFTKRMRPERLYALCEHYINLMWPLSRIITRLPYGRSINQKLLVPELMTSGKYRKFSDELHKQWALLHLFDWLNPTYDKPQHIETFHHWLEQSGLCEVETNFGYGGIEGRGIRA
jgi:SAM-dependent methyltransferase